MGLCRRSYNFEDAAASPFATGVADPYKHPSYVSYHASFCRSRSNVASVIKEIRLRKTGLLNFWRRWGLTPEDGRGRS